ncbi:hypothetical protein C8J57DRAFT_1712437 [Mycena rebaudengoi]|nr:hypothetical protein C8J57DRAFT_1712437 [Mycena rebaudengoi]
MPPLPVVTFSLGGWGLGTHADLILQGILFAQFTNYWSRYYKSDPLSQKLFVLGLCIATTFKSAHAIALVWVQNVDNFMNLNGAAGMFLTNWLSQSNLLITEIIAFSVQAFFCRRLWIISKNIYVVAFVVLLFVFGLISAIVHTAFKFSGLMYVLSHSATGNYFKTTAKEIWSKIRMILRFLSWPQSYHVPGPIHVGTVVVGDVILSASIIYFLLRRSQQAPLATVGILNRLIRIAFQAAVPVTLCALANFICQALYLHHTSIDATILCILVSGMMLPKVYAISALWTLNSRNESSRFGTDVNGDIHSSSSSVHFSSRQMATTIQLGQHSVDGLNSRKEMSNRFGADFSGSPESFKSRGIATTNQFRRHSIVGGPTARNESQPETYEMADIPVHMFELRIKPHPDDINPSQVDA